jgi:TRAP-type C4-dicarboxylate transport system substrate-binding protein
MKRVRRIVMKSFSKIIAGLILFLAITLGLFCQGKAIAAPADPSPKIIIRLSHGYSTTYIRHKSARKWKELLEKESQGQVEVKIYPAGQLVKPTEEINALMMGSIDMAAVHGGPLSSLVPLWDVFILPFFWPNDGKNFEPAWKFKQSAMVKRIMISKLEEKGIKFIGFNTVVGGSSEFCTTKRTVKNISDFQGLKMATVAGWLRFEAVKAIGASCITLPTTEIAQALAQGTVDGEFGTLTNILAGGLPVKYVYWWPSWCNDTGASFLMNMKKWRDLPDNIKKLIDNYGTPEMQSWTNKEVLVEEAQALIDLKKRGIQVESDAALQEECSKRLQFIPDLFAKKYGKDGQELIAGARALMGK